MSDLLDEIKEDLTRERYALIWRKYGNYVIGTAISILIITGAAVFGKNYMDARYASYNDALYEANTAPAQEAIKKYDEIITNANSTYKAIAGLRKAAIFIQDSKFQDALNTYKKIIEISNSPKELKDLAKLLYISVSSNLSTQNKEFKDADRAKYLQEDIGDGVFKYSMMEINAFQEMDSHNYTKAKDIFTQLTEGSEVPQNIKTRAKEMIDTIANISDTGTDKSQEKKNG